MKGNQHCHPDRSGAAAERSREPALSEVEGDLRETDSCKQQGIQLTGPSTSLRLWLRFARDDSVILNSNKILNKEWKVWYTGMGDKK